MMRIPSDEELQELTRATRDVIDSGSEDPAIVERHARLAAPMAAAAGVFAVALVVAFLGPHAAWYAWPLGAAIGLVCFMLWRADFLTGHVRLARLRRASLWIKVPVHIALVFTFLLGPPLAAAALLIIGPDRWLATLVAAASVAFGVATMGMWLWLRITPVVFPPVSDRAAIQE